MDADVIVLGGGFAGIAAARDLREAGARSIVLEARDRIGGRTWYREIPGTGGVHAGYGGMFFSRQTQPNLAEEISRYGIGVSPAVTDPDMIAWIRGATRVEGPSAYEQAQEGLAASSLPAEIERTASSLVSGDREALAALDVAIPRWIETLGVRGVASDYLRAFLAAMGGSRLERLSILPLLWDMAELDYTPADAFIDMGELFTDGTKSLIDAMATELDIRFGSVVAGVTTNSGTVTVSLATGERLTARAVVVALPLNCWADVRFEPGLSPAKGRGRLFMGFSVQDRLDLADGAAVRAAINAHLPASEVILTDGHDWVNDPYSKGTWLAIPPGWFGDGTFDRLAEPEGRLAFAGSDVASEGAGWIEGAIASGRAAATRCLELVPA